MQRTIVLEFRRVDDKTIQVSTSELVVLDQLEEAVYGEELRKEGFEQVSSAEVRAFLKLRNIEV